MESNADNNKIIVRQVTEILDAGSINDDIMQPVIKNEEDENTVTTTSTTDRRSVIIEPAIFLIFLAMNISGIVFQNLVLYQTCTSVFNYNVTECKKLGTAQATDLSEKIEAQIQPYAGKIFMTSTLVQSIIPAIISIFLGPWSDKFGRKPVILSTFIGYFLFYLLLCILSFISMKYTVNPWVYIIAVIPVSLSGATCALITGIFCFIADVTTNKNRAYRMVLLEAFIFIGLLCGSLSSSYLLAATNSFFVFLTSLVMISFAIIYLIFFVDESLSPEQISSELRIKGLLQWVLVKDMFKTCFEKRPDYDRTIIWLIISCLGIAIFVLDGSMTVFYLFVREKFGWTVKDYSLYDSAAIIIQIFGNIIGGYFLQKFLGLSLTSVALFAFGSGVIDSVIKLTAIYPWHLYLAISFGFLRGMGGPMCRAILSSLVPPKDVGKLYSLTTSIETISPLISAPLYTYVYTLTLPLYPGAFNAITTFMFLICYIFLAIVYGIQKSYSLTSYGVII